MGRIATELAKMADFPELKDYKILQELGHNSLGGRVTYLANQVATNDKVVIKQFQFAQLGNNWQEYETYKQELNMLRSLNHPSIPRYLDSFSTSNGFCLVQEYIEAVPLTTQRNWTPDSIRQLALSILDILIYLQQQQPCIIHRDLKPENILIGKNEKVYLVDFGFARSGGGEVAVSSVVKGTLGFMPPEQLFNRQLTEAADLYGLGMTLICLLTGTKSANVGSLIDANYYVHFRHLVLSGANGWLNWLERLVEANPSERFVDAKQAKKTLEEIDLTRLPKLRLSEEKIYLEVKEYGDKVTASLEVTNPIPDTLISGRWEVAVHKSDPPHSPYEHSWIKIHPPRFSSNQQTCQIEVDTSKLLAQRIYHRQLILHSNCGEDSRIMELKVKTQRLPRLPSFSYSSLIGVASIYFLAVLLVGSKHFSIFFSGNDSYLHFLFFSCSLGILWGTFINDRLLSVAKIREVRNIYTGLAVTTFINTFIGLGIVWITPEILSSLIGVIGFCTCILIGLTLFKYKEEKLLGPKINNRQNLTKLFFSILIIYSLLVILVPILSSSGENFIFLYLFGGNSLIVVFLSSIFLGYKILEKAKSNHESRLGFTSSEASSLSLLTAGLGASIGAAILATYQLMIKANWPAFNLQQQLIIIAIASISAIAHTTFLSKLIIFKRWQIRRTISQYQAIKEQLIKP